MNDVWLKRKEILDLFKKELGFERTVVDYLIYKKFASRIKKKRYGLLQFRYNKDDILKLIEELKNERN